ncbi:TetR family transcriptional regulator [Herbidospora sp. NEAU-GS84]|uniref:TetR family transcriptional regulator n=1 Tax=Herbidospora solisilvae TaxID=2696284 RepID=A0A7C9N1D7_9ACTN|nr:MULTISPECIES: TetR/AcrR family transcriptional regulator [Herbidospora]NAS21474.1 TetR family transcriptional regulator [Herbidospora solisilvae]GLX94523.1 TetR family transcriptional regulator [Herbidospora sp. NBRC 101105]
MPLPRFDRLPAGSRAAILAVARAHFARDGKDAASFNQIIADARISKTSAYHYFDGKDDLWSAVVADASARALRVLGPWRPAESADDLWERLRSGSARLSAHLRDHPDDRAVLAAGGGSGSDGWIADLVADATRIGLVDVVPGIEAATAGVFAAVDRWALDHPDEPDPAGPLLVLLARLWGVPETKRPPKHSGAF